MAPRQRNHQDNPSNRIESSDRSASPDHLSGPEDPRNGRSRRRSRRSDRQSGGIAKKRRGIVETLEPRQLLAGPQLIGVQPNQGELITDGTVRNTAPSVLTFRFDESQVIDPSTLDAIQIFSPGENGVFEFPGTVPSDDTPVAVGATVIGNGGPNEVEVRFASPLADGDYQLRISSVDDPVSGDRALRNIEGDVFRPRTADGLVDLTQRAQTIDFELQLGAIVESVVPQPVIRNADGSLSQNRDEVVVYFNEDPLFVENALVGTLTDAAGNVIELQLDLSEDLFGGLDVELITAGPTSSFVFESNVAADLITISVPAGSTVGDVVAAINDAAPSDPGSVANDAQNLIRRLSARAISGSGMAFNAGAGVSTTITRQPTQRSAENPRFYQLFLTQGTVRTTDDALFLPERVVYDPATFTSRLFFARDLNELTPADSINGNEGVGAEGGTFRLRIGTAVDVASDIILTPQVVPVTTPAGDTLATSFDLTTSFGQLGSGNLDTIVVAGQIDGGNFDIELPGGDLADAEARGFFADTTPGSATIPYNFQSAFGGPSGQLNQITSTQRLRVREVLNLYAEQLGVQFIETEEQGITFAVGAPNALQPSGGVGVSRQFQSAINASLRIDPAIGTTPATAQSAVVFSNQVSFNENFGEDFTRKAAAAVGLVLGLNATPDLPNQTLLALDGGPNGFLNQSINVSGGTTATDLEPVFPSNFDVLQGQVLYRPDSNDVDLYRFEVNLNDEDRVGSLVAQTFAERLADSSLLDTTLTLFEQTNAFAESDLGFGSPLNVRFEAIAEGRQGNDTEIRFVRSGRVGNDTSVNITRAIDTDGNEISNAIVVDLPRIRSASTPVPTVGQIVDAINNSPISSGLLVADFIGDPAVIAEARDTPADAAFDLTTVELDRGGVFPLVRNDDYFGEDSRITANLGAGVYFLGVASTGNEIYDPTIADSGFGGRTSGEYELRIRFEPNVDETDVLRDLDGDRDGAPGTPLDGDGDGTPRGEFNFWFETRSLNRVIDFTTSGEFLNSGQTMTVTTLRDREVTYQFVAAGDPVAPGNVRVAITTPSGVSLGPAAIANAFESAFLAEQSVNDVNAFVTGSTIEFEGIRSIELSPDFVGLDVFGRTLFVDKLASVQSDGSLNTPFNNIANDAVPNAFGATQPGDIVRIVGNGGGDDDLTTESDNLAYLVGIAPTGGRVLEDGRNLEVPEGVTTMIDAGAILKFRASRIGVGSSVVTENRNDAVLQVLGTPRTVTLSRAGDPVVTTVVPDAEVISPGGLGYRDGAVILTSLNDTSVGVDTIGTANPAAGDWGGVVFRRDIDQGEGRTNLEDAGIFLQTVLNTDIRYGGSSNVLIDSIQSLVNPIQIFNLRPTIAQNEIRFSADAAISASPDSFEETTFAAPQFQSAGDFTADYDRVGPAIYDNLVIDNSINGLFIRVSTTPSAAPAALTTSARFDDVDIVHFFAENLILEGTPGGAIQTFVAPDFATTSFAVSDGGNLADGDYNYRLTFVDRFGFESLPSNPSADISVNEGGQGAIEILNLPPVPVGDEFIGRRLYRLNPTTGEYQFLTRLNATDDSFLDTGETSQGVLDLTRAGIRGRLDASLVVDPGLVMKFNGTRIELQNSTQLLAEGLARDTIVMTSFADDRFGAGGTFDTNNDDNTLGGEQAPLRGQWSGVYAGATAYVSLDNALVAYGGGISTLETGTRGFAALELQQADARVANSRFEFNEDGQDGQADIGRSGLLGVTPSTIFVRGSQPVIVANEFVDNRGTIIDIDVDSLTAERLVDNGRQTEFIGRFDSLDNNYGPLVRLNRYASVDAGPVTSRQLSGMEVRGGTITTETIFDDTDIDHLLFDALVVGNEVVQGGLKLLSRPGQSLVVKLSGSGSPYEENFGTGITATGVRDGETDRIGGAVQIVGVPGAEVVLTSLLDDTIGSGTQPDGSPLLDTGGDGSRSRPEGNDWRSVLFDRYSHDRNFAYILEETVDAVPAPGLNGTTVNAQFLGTLAANVLEGDEARRLGFEVEGFLTANEDVDTYSFQGEAGTQIFFDIDKTSFNLDTVVEFLDQDGNVLVRSDNSFAEVGPEGGTGQPLEDVDPLVAAGAGTLSPVARGLTPFDSLGTFVDVDSSNPRDAGLSLTLPGNPGNPSTYFVRVRSDSNNPDDVDGGLTDGGYRLQIRLTETQETPGSVVRFADIRYANHGIHLIGKPSGGPLTGDAQENEDVTNVGSSSNDRIILDDDFIFSPGTSVIGGFGLFGGVTLDRPQYIGQLDQTADGSISVGGSLSTLGDVDFYRVDVGAGEDIRSTIFDIDYADGFSRPDTSLAVYYDVDGDGPLRPRLVAYGTGSNVFDDIALAGQDVTSDLLNRGSVDTGDPLIGPLSLTPGIYYVGVLQEGQTPEALLSPTVRREPIEVLGRIFEDRVGPLVDPLDPTLGTSPTPATTADPAEQATFVNVAATTGFLNTNARGGTPGHQVTSIFNGARVGVTGDSLVIPDFSVDNGTLTVANAAPIEAVAPAFSLAPDPLIGDRTQNTSTFIPHVTIDGNIGGDAVDLFQFTVPTQPDGSAFGTVILDVDEGRNPFAATGDEDDDVPAVQDPTSVDLQLFLFDENDNLIGRDLFDLATVGALGSLPNFLIFSQSLFSDDPYLQLELTPGDYKVAVAPEDATFDAATGTFAIADDARPSFAADYLLQVSIDGKSTIGNDPGNFLFYANRQTLANDAVLVSDSFDLTGYSPDDLPRFYTSYFYDPSAGDDVDVVAVITEPDPTNPANTVEREVTLSPVELQSGINPTTAAFNQAIYDLGPVDSEGRSLVAGASDVRIEVRYAIDPFTFDGAEGLYLDDFIVGFAERGELVTGAAAGEVGVVGTGSSVTGEYQLEIRSATQYSDAFGVPAETFDTNARFARRASLVAPAPADLVDGDTFVLSDTVDVVRFEFDLTGDGVTPGNIPVVITGATTDDEVASAIRDALNTPLVQSRLGVTSADRSGGVELGPAGPGRGRGNEVAVDGLLVGDFTEVPADGDLTPGRATFADSPTATSIALPVRFYDGFGDSNVERSQAVTFVDSNQISDVRAIGIYSTYGNREGDPQIDQPAPGQFTVGFGDTFFGFGGNQDVDTDNDFLEAPPLGNIAPGAVRNLPRLNDDVVGGLTAGPVIVNNTVDQAGYAGIKIDGATRPFVIDSDIFGVDDFGDTPSVETRFGDFISDGLVMIVDAAGTRVAFEFEDVRGAPIIEGGSGTLGGDGYADGHVPIIYSHTAGAYNPGPPRDIRTGGTTRHETMMAIYQAIQGSILVTNGLSELVNVTLAPSPFIRSPFEEQFYTEEMAYPTPAVYVEGASGIYWDTSFQKVGPFGTDNNPFGNGGIPQDTGAGPFYAALAPTFEAVQSTPRVINNTIFGDDGTASDTPADTSEGNDTLAEAVLVPDNVPFTFAGTLGDELTPLAAATDVDVFRVELVVGDRLVVDVDVDAATELDTVLRLFDETGTEIAFSDNDVLRANLDRGGDDVAFVDENNNGTLEPNEVVVDQDPSLDFTAATTGSYFVAVSGVGNATFDPQTVDGRQIGLDQTGSYDLAIDVFEPETFVLSYFNPATVSSTPNVDVSTLIGTTFTLTMPNDIGVGQNTQVFQFSANNNAALPGAIAVNIGGADLRTQDVMEQIAQAINGANLPFLDRQAFAAALGGQDGVDLFPGGERGLIVYNGPITFARDYEVTNGVGMTPQSVYLPVGIAEFQRGFGHDRTGQVGSPGPYDGTTENYVFIERAARLELSPEAIAAGLGSDPLPGQQTDQLIPEVGLMLTGGTSATVINNVFANLHQSLVREETALGGFSAGPDLTLRPADVIVTANVFQDDEVDVPLFRRRIPTAFSGGGNNATGVGLTTDAATGPSNINGGTDDFNITAAGTTQLFINAQADNFLPTLTSPLIDSSVNSLVQRDEERALLTAIGITPSNILAPNRDINGVLRVDNPNVAPPPGLGANVFKDRGSNEFADFVGPIATIIDPRDNDSEGIDLDPAISVISLEDQTLDRFRIQLTDTGDQSDPFRGLGVDDATVVVSEIDGLRRPGANFTLFENERLLVEGIDYSFQYDETQNIVTLTPLAGVFRDDRAYRIAVNNANSTVITAPPAAALADGDRLTITDANNARLVFEIETGISVDFPDPVTLIVPPVGVGVGGITDNDVVSITDGAGSTVLFEFDAGTGTLPSTRPIDLPAGGVPGGGPELQTFRATIATLIADAINAAAADPELDFDVVARADGVRVVVGGEAGTFANTASSGLRQDARTLAIQVPSVGIANNDGRTFLVSDGTVDVIFEIDTDGVLVDENNIPINVLGQTSVQSADAIAMAIADSELALQPTTIGNGDTVFLNLPADGRVETLSSDLSVRGVGQAPEDGDTLTITPAGGGDPVVLEFNRTDVRNVNGEIDDDGVADGNIAVDITRDLTGIELAGAVRDVINSLAVNIGGLNPATIEIFDGGLLAIGGAPGLSVDADSATVVSSGAPGVTESSTLTVAGPIELTLPFAGGAELEDGDLIVLVGDDGTDTVLEFVLNNRPTSVIGAIPVGYTNATQSSTLGSQLVNLINAQDIGITASVLDDQRLSLGVIPLSRVRLDGSASDGTLFQNLATGTRAPENISAEVGLVRDGERFTITQGTVSVTYEFELSGTGGGVADGNVPIAFSSSSTPDSIGGIIASTIASNLRGLELAPVADGDGNTVLNDRPGTIIDASLAPSIRVGGVPGGATVVSISQSNSPVEVKEALIQAINSIDPALTGIRASDRGGASLLISGGELFDGPFVAFNLPAVADVAGNPLEANRVDGTTAFTILTQAANLDYGDAPDPRDTIPGRYPTQLQNDGARHVVDPADAAERLFLGSSVDVEGNGRPSVGADGDDFAIVTTTTGLIFDTVLDEGEITITPGVTADQFFNRDGDTITITSGLTTATLEFDIDGRFDEDNFAVSATTLAEFVPALVGAIAESPLDLASVSPLIAGNGVVVSADDEDGVVFGGANSTNPSGFLNPGVALPVTVTVAGAGVLEAWIDFDADGDFDPDEQILPQPTSPQVSALRATLCDAETGAMVSNIFDGTSLPTRTFCVVVPPTATLPETQTETYARFRVSREGDLQPDGLALSGEVEDYRLIIQPGGPPVLTDVTANRNYTVREGARLQILDATGAATASPADDGLLVGITDPDGQGVRVFNNDVGPQSLIGGDGVTVVGTVNVFANGTFIANPDPEYFGPATFSVRVSDANPNSPDDVLVAARRINVTVDVTPVNDPPERFANNDPFVLTINEDEPFTLDASIFIDPFFNPGPDNESDQSLVFQSADFNIANQSELGGSLSISSDGRTLLYTPPADVNASDDRFFFTVGDVPGAGQSPRVAPERIPVRVVIEAVNDAPRAGTDTYNVDEGNQLIIPINGPEVIGGESVDGILDNDVAGPPDELVVENGNVQQVRLDLTQFPITTDRGGTVTQSGNRLTYTPPPFFSGRDAFNYNVMDRLVDANGNEIPGLLGAMSSGRVIIDVGSVNDPPEFLRVDANGDATPIVFDEARVNNQVNQFDLNTFFRDREGDPITYSVSSGNTNIVGASVDNATDILTLTLPEFSPGMTTITLSATDAPTGSDPLTTTVTIPVNVTNLPDAPELLGSIGTLITPEDNTATIDLRTIFRDRDGFSDLSFAITQIGDITGPSPVIQSAIDANPILESITTPNGVLTIRPTANANGTVLIGITASDGVQSITDVFTLNVEPVADPPVANVDGYNVALGSQLVINNPADGLLANDTDADGDTIVIAPESVGSFDTAFGLLTIAENGTFTYVNTGGALRGTDTFQYTILAGGQRSTSTVTFTFTDSLFQNPIDGRESDVNADGTVSAVDALLIVNLLRREGRGQISVSELSSPPPPFYDVDGDGVIQADDILTVINTIRASGPQGFGEGEQIGGSGVSVQPAITTSLGSSHASTVFGSTTTYAAADASGLPLRTATPASFGSLDVPVRSTPVRTVDGGGARGRVEDYLLAAGFDLSPAFDPSVAGPRESGQSDRVGGSDATFAADEALSELFDDFGPDLMESDLGDTDLAFPKS